jgi:hypothetical protein
MKNEELPYQIGKYLFYNKNQMMPDLPRETKGYTTDGVYDGVSDDWGFGRHFRKNYVMSIEQTVIDAKNPTDAQNQADHRDWALTLARLVGTGKQVTFFTMMTEAWATTDPVITYNYCDVQKHKAKYKEVFKAVQMELNFDTPIFFDCSDSVKYLAFNAIIPVTNKYNNSKKWNTVGQKWTNLPPYQLVSGMTTAQLFSNFSNYQDNPLGELYLEDEYFFATFKAPTFLGSSDFTKTILTTDWYPSIIGYETSFALSSLKLNGSLDNLCYLIKLEKQWIYGDWVEIINQQNNTGLRIDCVKNSTTYDLLYYNFRNQELYDGSGQKLNTIDAGLEFSISIPESCVKELYWDKTIKSVNDTSATFYPNVRVISSSTDQLGIKIKNQRMYI